MRYLLVVALVLLTCLPTFAADVTIRDASITRQQVIECQALVLAYRDLLDEPAAGDIVVALEEAGTDSYVRFSKAVHNDSCANRLACHQRTAQACNLLGGALSDKGARVSMGETKQSCNARCVVNKELTFRIKFRCEDDPPAPR